MSPKPGEVDLSHIRLAVSSCLAGNPCRYDGTPAGSTPLMATLMASRVSLHPMCPEVAAGLGTPRPAIRQVRNPDGSIRLATSRTGEDVTAPLSEAVRTLVDTASTQVLDGIVLKSASPTCGLRNVKVYDGERSTRKGVGIFAAAVQDRFPHVPIEEEGRLRDPYYREAWLEAVFSRNRLTRLMSSADRPADLMEFHARHKYLIMARSPESLKRLGSLTASATRDNMPATLIRYEDLFMSTLRRPASLRRHINVLQHLAGYFKRHPRAERGVLRDSIERCGRGVIPRSATIELFRFLSEMFDVDYLRSQYYLDPYPSRLQAVA